MADDVRPTDPVDTASLHPTAGEVLALADDHRHGLHRQHPHIACSRCTLEALERPREPDVPPAS